MTAKDYKAIGQALHSSYAIWREVEAVAALNTATARIADVFEKDNPRFDRLRFLIFVETGKEVRSLKQ